MYKTDPECEETKCLRRSYEARDTIKDRPAASAAGHVMLGATKLRHELAFKPSQALRR